MQGGLKRAEAEQPHQPQMIPTSVSGLVYRCGAASKSLLCPVQTFFGLQLSSDSRLLVRKESGDFFKRPVRRLENDFGDQLILLSWESHDDLRHFFDESAGVPGTVPFP